jgi:hypothetical protein
MKDKIVSEGLDRKGTERNLIQTLEYELILGQEFNYCTIEPGTLYHAFGFCYST